MREFTLGSLFKDKASSPALPSYQDFRETDPMSLLLENRVVNGNRSGIIR